MASQLSAHEEAEPNETNLFQRQLAERLLDLCVVERKQRNVAGEVK